MGSLDGDSLSVSCTSGVKCFAEKKKALKAQLDIVNELLFAAKTPEEKKAAEAKFDSLSTEKGALQDTINNELKKPANHKEQN